MDQTKESIIQRIEDAIEKGGEEALKFFHDGATTIEAWLNGETSTGSAAQAPVDAGNDASVTTPADTPTSGT